MYNYENVRLNVELYQCSMLPQKKKLHMKLKRINVFRIPNIDLIIHIDMELGRMKFKQIFQKSQLSFCLPTEINFVPEENVIFGLYVWGA